MEGNEEFTLKTYFDNIAKGELIGSRCKKCGFLHVPPKKICQQCQSTDMEPFKFSGEGTLETFSLVHVGTRYFVNQGYSMKKPYCFGIVKLKEGPRVSAHIVAPDRNPDWESDPSNFKIGMPLKMVPLKVEIEGKEPRIDLGFQPA